MRSRALPAIAAALFLTAGAANGQYDNLVMSAASSLYAIPNGGYYDAANVYLAPDGSIWTASATENVILKLSADGLISTRWTFPTGAAPSYLLPNPDGTFWVNELGNPNFAKFDPATGDLTEWPDYSRRQAAMIRRSDGKFWATETGGPLALFDPDAGTITYSQVSSILSLSYPFMDDDESIWAFDFAYGYLVHFSKDGTIARRWLLPDVTSYPSKIIRGIDGALWCSIYGSGQIARYDTATSEIKLYDLVLGSLPYDLANYKGKILYSDQGYGVIGFFDPNSATPSLTQTLTPDATDLTLEIVVRTTDPVVTNLVPTNDDIAVPPPAISTGNQGTGLADYPVGIGSNWGLTVDEVNNRIIFATRGYIGTLFPPIPASVDDLYFPSAASIGGVTSRWKTQLIAWNRGTPDSTGTKNSISLAEQLIPDGWIAGYLPNSTQTVGVDQLLVQADPIGNEMAGPDSFGALRLEAFLGTTSDVFGWARVYKERADGGTYGFAMNPYKPAGAIQAGDSGYLFTPADTSFRTNAGYMTVDAAQGTVSIVDANGTTLASKDFKWPGGTHKQFSPLFSSFGIDPVPGARFVVSVTSGTVLPFGTSIDSITSDPVGLEFSKQSEAAPLQWLPAVFRGAGPLGSSSRTDLQLYNPGVVSATVQLLFRSASPGGTFPSAKVTVPAGKVVSLTDPLGSLLGLQVAAGILDVSSDQPVSVFATVRGSDPSGGTYGYGLAGKISTTAVPAGSRGVFLAATDNGWNVIQTDLLLANISDVATTVTLNLTNAYGVSAGTRDYALGPKEIRYVSAPWYSIAGYGTDAGRIDVLPSGTASVFATLLRKDLKTGDTDAILPAVTTK
jgi:streptogramin lyase